MTGSTFATALGMKRHVKTLLLATGQVRELLAGNDEPVVRNVWPLRDWRCLNCRRQIGEVEIGDEQFVGRMAVMTAGVGDRQRADPPAKLWPI